MGGRSGQWVAGVVNGLHVLEGWSMGGRSGQWVASLSRGGQWVTGVVNGWQEWSMGCMS